MRLATWNVNNVRKRLPQLLQWLDQTRPDIVALQELKTETAAFPHTELEAAGYNCLVVGQRTWNGVALLARGFEPIEIRRTLPGDAHDKQARFIEAAINGVAVACLYLPNGNPWPGPKFEYKLAWFERLIEHAASLMASGNPVVLAGDFNVVPTDALDIYSPDHWKDNALLQPEAREAYARLLKQGWTDALRKKYPTDRVYTFWDYLRNRWPRDAGLRIDHILLSPRLKLTDAGVDREMRANADPSDHAPAWAEFETAKAPRARKTARDQPASKATTPPAKRSARKAAESAAGDPPLAHYNAKRDFAKTAEPAGEVGAPDAAALRFVVQKHWASRLHYDFRLELDGVMVSWAVPKGPSYDPAIKNIAIHVEDHPISYNTFEGTIPKGEYGGGTVIVWDRGQWEPVVDPREGLAKGKLIFKLHGQKLAGVWELVRISKPGQKKQEEWLLLKKRGDAWARPGTEYDVITALPDSVVGKPLGLVEDREPRGVGAVARRRQVDPTADLQQAKKAKLPGKLEPQLATLVTSVPAGDWVAETKFDGYRLLARVHGADVRLVTRNGHDWTDRLEPLAQAVAAMGIDSAWLDGEIVVLNDADLPDFNQLQNAIDNARTADIEFFVFDAPFLEGRDLRPLPLASRRALLKQVFDERTSDVVHFSEGFEAPPGDMLAAACQLGLEGVMVKRADAPYTSGRTETWLKLKCQQRQEFVVVGFTDRSSGNGEVGGLLLGYHEAGQLRYAGSVGTGWGGETGRQLRQMLLPLEIPKPAVDPQDVAPGRWSRRKAGTERWVRPLKVVEVAFSEWTPEGHVRHPTFRGVREDKPAGQIVRERPKGQASGEAGGARATQKSASSVKVTHPDRVIDPSTGFRKVDLVRYYESVARWMLPHLKNRPVSLVRAPAGITGQLFFQKHPESATPGLRELDPSLWPGHSALLAVDDVDALVSAAQLNVIEFHTWNSTTRHIDQPDRFILDLDPGEGVNWQMLQEAAVLTRTMLTELGLDSWLKTSGGKGLHVVVPVTPREDYDTVKTFSQAIVRHMARVIPSRFVAVSGGTNRVGKIFIDYLRNGFTQTTACAFSARSRPGMGVSMPVDWDQLKDLKGGAQWTIATAREYLSFQKDDPWADFWKKKQTIGKAQKLLVASGRSASS